MGKHRVTVKSSRSMNRISRGPANKGLSAQKKPCPPVVPDSNNCPNRRRKKKTERNCKKKEAKQIKRKKRANERGEDCVYIHTCEDVRAFGGEKFFRPGVFTPVFNIYSFRLSLFSCFPLWFRSSTARMVIEKQGKKTRKREKEQMTGGTARHVGGERGREKM